MIRNPPLQPTHDINITRARKTTTNKSVHWKVRSKSNERKKTTQKAKQKHLGIDCTRYSAARQREWTHSRTFMKMLHLATSSFLLKISTFTIVTTGWSKKRTPQFYFWDNFGNSAPILTILSLLQAEIYAA